jgi:uncharacterized repeat protein (TIGR03809 family)
MDRRRTQLSVQDFFAMTPSPYLNKNAEIARKWRALIQRRREHLTQLYRSGRYKRYFTEEKLLNQMREAAKAAQEWDAVIAATAQEGVVDLAVRMLERGKAA